MFRQTPLLFFSRKLSFFSIFKSWGNTCEKVECTKPMEPVEKYVVEKCCAPSIFKTWKPKIPELKSNPIRAQLMSPFKPARKCSPGMKLLTKTRCEIDAEAKEYEKRLHPKWLKHCPAKPKYKVDEPLPPLRAALVQCKESKGKIDQKPKPKKMRKKCSPEVPEPDWNHDGFLG